MLDTSVNDIGGELANGGLAAVVIVGLAAVITGFGAVTSGFPVGDVVDDGSDLFTVDEDDKGKVGLFVDVEKFVSTGKSGLLKVRSLFAPPAADL
ncbi:MAG: hypothetical protein GY696_15280 [Gammaproteobacteria bacterium]|nr:hypothetical protein [Gammaproteobacteria bacterium]